MRSRVGSWAFLIGVILALILGAFGAVSQIMATLLVLLGLIIGFLNITQKETKPFLMASVVFVVVSFLGKGEMTVIPVLGNMLHALFVLFVPATIVVALKSVFVLAKN